MTRLTQNLCKIVHSSGSKRFLKGLEKFVLWYDNDKTSAYDNNITQQFHILRGATKLQKYCHLLFYQNIEKPRLEYEIIMVKH